MLVSGVSVLLLLNMHYVLAYWLEGRKTEIFIRWLTGATNKKLLFYLTSRYLLLAWIGAAAGILCASLCLKYSFSPWNRLLGSECIIMTGTGLGITL